MGEQMFTMKSKVVGRPSVVNDDLENAVFWNVALCISCVNQTSSETSVHIRNTQRHILENSILHSQRHENLKSYIVMILFIMLTKKSVKDATS
jgi:hypothetical protein